MCLCQLQAAMQAAGFNSIEVQDIRLQRAMRLFLAATSTTDIKRLADDIRELRVRAANVQTTD